MSWVEEAGGRPVESEVGPSSLNAKNLRFKDHDNAFARKFGLVFELPDSHKEVFEAPGIDVEKINGDDSYGFPDPATDVIGPDGAIRWAYVPNNYRKRAEPEQLIKELEAVAALVEV